MKGESRFGYEGATGEILVMVEFFCVLTGGRYASILVINTYTHKHTDEYK